MFWTQYLFDFCIAGYSHRFLCSQKTGIKWGYCQNTLSRLKLVYYFFWQGLEYAINNAILEENTRDIPPSSDNTTMKSVTFEDKPINNIDSNQTFSVVKYGNSSNQTVALK